MCVCTYIPAFIAQLYLTRGRPRGRAARAEKAAHTEDNEVTAAVFHAPMFALNAFAYWNTCAPSHPRSTPTGRRSHVSARMHGRPNSHARGGAHTGAHVGRVCTPIPTSHSSTHIHICI